MRPDQAEWPDDVAVEEALQEVMDDPAHWSNRLRRPVRALEAWSDDVRRAVHAHETARDTLFWRMGAGYRARVGRPSTSGDLPTWSALRVEVWRDMRARVGGGGRPSRDQAIAELIVRDRPDLQRRVDARLRWCEEEGIPSARALTRAVKMVVGERRFNSIKSQLSRSIRASSSDPLAAASPIGPFGLDDHGEGVRRVGTPGRGAVGSFAGGRQWHAAQQSSEAGDVRRLAALRRFVETAPSDLLAQVRGAPRRDANVPDLRQCPRCPTSRSGAAPR